MVAQPQSISLFIGATKAEFLIHRSIELGDSADVAIVMTISEKALTFQSNPTIVSLKDLVRLGDYIKRALSEEVDYEYVPLNLGFEFYVNDNDDCESTVRLLLLAAEPEGQSRSYIGCRGPVLKESLARFATQLKECAVEWPSRLN
jgi:hypothetical protein